jgi:hypothetical protein
MNCINISVITQLSWVIWVIINLWYFCNCFVLRGSLRFDDFGLMLSHILLFPKSLLPGDNLLYSRINVFLSKFSSFFGNWRILQITWISVYLMKVVYASSVCY